MIRQPEPGATAGAAPGRSPRRRILVVVPTYDEVHNVGPLRRRLHDAVEEAEILFVDDASPDGTGDRIAAMRRNDRRVRLIRRPCKLGLGTAYLAGFELGLRERFDVVATMDADLSHDPAHLPELVAATARHDLVLGSRYVTGGRIENWGLHRRLLSRGANRAARSALGLRVRDVTTGFRAYRTSALRALPLASIRSSGYSFLEEITYLAERRNLRIAEVPIVFSDREGGRSKISTAEIVLAAYHLMRLRLARKPAAGASPDRARPSSDGDAELGGGPVLAGADARKP